MRGHVQFIEVSSVHIGQMVTEINFKFCKGLKGIEIILAPCNIIILDKLDKTVKIDLFIKVINRDIHSITVLNAMFKAKTRPETLSQMYGTTNPPTTKMRPLGQPRYTVQGRIQT